MTDEEWEALCDGCGLCCETQHPSRGGRAGVACPGLDCATNRCTVYDRRQASHPCIRVRPANVPELYARGVLPESCGYVRHAQKKPPLAEPPRAKLIPFVLAHPVYQEEWLAKRREWMKTYRPRS